MTLPLSYLSLSLSLLSLLLIFIPLPPLHCLHDSPVSFFPLGDGLVVILFLSLSSRLIWYAFFLPYLLDAAAVYHPVYLTIWDQAPSKEFHLITIPLINSLIIVLSRPSLSATGVVRPRGSIKKNKTEGEVEKEKKKKKRIKKKNNNPVRKEPEQKVCHLSL